MIFSPGLIIPGQGIFGGVESVGGTAASVATGNVGAASSFLSQSGTQTLLLGALAILMIVVGLWALVGGQTVQVVTTAAKAGAA